MDSCDTDSGERIQHSSQRTEPPAEGKGGYEGSYGKYPAYHIGPESDVLAVAAEELRWLKPFTFFTAYEPQVFVSVAVDQPEHTWSLLLFDDQGAWTDLGPLGYNLILLGIGLMSYIAATVIFCRRDLPAPL